MAKSAVFLVIASYSPLEINMSCSVRCCSSNSNVDKKKFTGITFHRNEDLIDDDIDYHDLINDEEEEKLLLEDEDIDDSGILEKSVKESSLNNSELEDKLERNKFTTERKKITAPESSASTGEVTSKRTKAGTTGHRQSFSARGGRGRPNNRKNKTVLINPRFQGILHVNNNNVSAHLGWTNQRQHNGPPVNPWIAGADPQNVVVAQPQHMAASTPIQAHMQMQVTQFQQPQYQQQFQGPLPLQPQPYQMQYQPQHLPNLQQERQVFLPQSVPIIINTAQPPPTIQHNFQSQIPQINSAYSPQPQFPSNQQIFSHNQQYTPPHFQQPFPPNNQFLESKQFPNFGGNTNFNQNKSNFQIHGMNTNLQNKFQRKHFKNRIGPVALNKFQKANMDPESLVANRSSVIKIVPVKEEPIIEDEDEEMYMYRMKIEEQKRQREAFLRQKEERRLKSLKVLPSETKQGSSFPQLKKQKSPNIVVTNGFSRRLTKYQKNSKNFSLASNTLTTIQVTEDIEEKIDVKQLPGFLQERRVLQKDETLINTRSVLVKNLSSSTADKKIMMICRNIGDVQSLERIKDDRQATIVFKSVASAHAFYKKYQRYMLDLSMIEVSLRAETE